MNKEKRSIQKQADKEAKHLYEYSPCISHTGI